MTTIHNHITVEAQREPVKLGFAAMLLLALVVAVIVNYWLYITAAAAIITVAVLTYRSLAAQAAEKRGLAERADQQDRLFLAGDPRGVYGDHNEGLWGPTKS